MPQAKPGPGLRCRILPLLLLSAGGAAFAGLAVSPAELERQPAVLAYTDVGALPVDAVAEEQAVARASRSRRLPPPAPSPSPEPSPAPEPVAQPAAPKPAPKPPPKQPAPVAPVAAACPVPNATFTDTWGAPRSGGRAHKGTDLMAPHGSPIYAVAPGVVRTASSGAGGISLYLRADNGETYFYAHNSANLVASGARVTAGQLIARVGSSGNASAGAPHLHFEREVGGASVNPYAFLRRLCR